MQHHARPSDQPCVESPAVPIVLFLCTGNYYRSRFAEHLFNALAERRGLVWSATSRGLAIELGAHLVGPMATAALEALTARGVEPAAPLRKPAQVTHDDLAGAQRIIALYDREHRPLVMQRYPAWVQRVEYWRAPDVDELTLQEGLALIEREVVALVDELANASKH